MKPSSYGRGVGYTSESSCTQHEGPCEKWGLLWYPKCRDSFHNVGCCVCSPNCLSSQLDIGVSCQKDSYGRGVGKALGCTSGEEFQLFRCYDSCKPGYEGLGPLCTSTCPGNMFACGPFCLNSEAECTQKFRDVATHAFKVYNDFGAVTSNFTFDTVFGMADDAAKLALDLVLVPCEVSTQ